MPLNPFASEWKPPPAAPIEAKLGALKIGRGPGGKQAGGSGGRARGQPPAAVAAASTSQQARAEEAGDEEELQFEDAFEHGDSSAAGRDADDSETSTPRSGVRAFVSTPFGLTTP